jgi:hypothetical protein
MRKILSEKSLVVILFIAALVVFSFAQEDARKVEKMYLEAGAAGSYIIKHPRQTAGISDGVKPPGQPVEK